MMRKNTYSIDKCSSVRSRRFLQSIFDRSNIDRSRPMPYRANRRNGICPLSTESPWFFHFSSTVLCHLVRKYCRVLCPQLVIGRLRNEYSLVPKGLAVYLSFPPYSIDPPPAESDRMDLEERSSIEIWS